MNGDLPQNIPAISRVLLNSNQELDSRHAERVVERLYTLNRWEVLERRFRMRGSEIDLAMFHPQSLQARIVEVKLRNNFSTISLNSTKDLLTHRKIAALTRGANALNQRTQIAGLKLNWSFDMALVVPESKDRCLVYTWPNAVELHQ